MKLQGYYVMLEFQQRILTAKTPYIELCKTLIFSGDAKIVGIIRLFW